MKKSILSLAVLLASSVGFSAIAQNPCQPSKACTENNCKAKPCDKKDAPSYCPFEGLNLTDKQKSELQSIAPAKPTKEQKAQAKAEKQAKKKAKAECRQQARRDYLAKVKGILTPEQYLQFLENNYVNNIDRQGPRHGKFDKKDRAHRGDKAKGMKGRKDRRAKGAMGKPANAQADSTYFIDNGQIKVFPYQAQR